MRKGIFWFVLAFLAFSTCKKIDLPTVNPEPIFGLKGQLDGTDFDWQAGVAEKYMLATFDDSTAGEPRFVADLGQLESSTTNGFPKIVIEFFGEGSAANWPSILTARKVDFAQKGLVLQQKRLLWLQNLSLGNSPMSFLWQVGGQASIEANPVFEFSDLDFSGEISLRALDGLARETRQSRFLDLKNEQEWSVRLSKNQSQIFAQITSPDSSGSVDWSNGDSLVTSISIDSMMIQNAASAIFFGGKTASAQMVLDPQNAFSANVAAADFSWATWIRTDSLFSVGGFEPRRVLVHYFDQNGQRFSTNQAIQPSSSLFEIIKVEPFERNEAGILTQKITVRFDCVLADEKGQTKKMSSVEGVIAVGVPD